MSQIDIGFRNNDTEKIKIAAHSLKTQLNYMGVKEEDSHVAEIEQMVSRTHLREELKERIDNLQEVCTKAFQELSDYVDAI